MYSKIDYEGWDEGGLKSRVKENKVILCYVLKRECFQNLKRLTLFCTMATTLMYLYNTG